MALCKHDQLLVSNIPHLPHVPHVLRFLLLICVMVFALKFLYLSRVSGHPGLNVCLLLAWSLSLARAHTHTCTGTHPSTHAASACARIHTDNAHPNVSTNDVDAVQWVVSVFILSPRHASTSRLGPTHTHSLSLSLTWPTQTKIKIKLPNSPQRSCIHSNRLVTLLHSIKQRLYYIVSNTLLHSIKQQILPSVHAFSQTDLSLYYIVSNSDHACRRSSPSMYVCMSVRM